MGFRGFRGLRGFRVYSSRALGGGGLGFRVFGGVLQGSL